MICPTFSFWEPEKPLGVTMKMTCDRCKKEFDGEQGPDFTSGFYQVGPSGKAWGQFANPGETIVCDVCVWNDPRYIAVYGTVASGLLDHPKEAE
jgi:hypothetical protein